MIDVENIDTWYPIIKGKGARYYNQFLILLTYVD